jgi:hypothetical protein
MRRLAMRFRGIMKGANLGKLDPWVDDASRSGINCIRQFEPFCRGYATS